MTKTLTPEGAVKQAIHGYDGTQWRKLGLLFGYTDRWFEQVVIADAAAGNNFLDAAPVPSGYVYVSSVIAGVDATSNLAEILFGIKIGETYYYMKRVPTPGVAIYAEWSGAGIFKAGDIPMVVMTGVTAHDVLVANFWGYKMAVG